jgi:hypothetical protein
MNTPNAWDFCTHYFECIFGGETPKTAATENSKTYSDNNDSLYLHAASEPLKKPITLKSALRSETSLTNLSNEEHPQNPPQLKSVRIKEPPEETREFHSNSYAAESRKLPSKNAPFIDSTDTLADIDQDTTEEEAYDRYFTYCPIDKNTSRFNSDIPEIGIPTQQYHNLTFPPEPEPLPYLLELPCSVIDATFDLSTTIAASIVRTTVVEPIKITMYPMKVAISISTGFVGGLWSFARVTSDAVKKHL